MIKKGILIILTWTVNCCYGQTELQNNFQKGVNSLKSESFNEAISTFTTVLKEASDVKLKKFCYIYRAFSYNGIHDYKSAIADLDKAIELDSSDLASFTDRGKSKAHAKDIEGAKKDFLLILAKDSVGSEAQAALFYLGKISYQEQMFEESVNFYDRLIKLSPNEPEFYFNRACAKGMLFKSEESIKDYDKAIDLDKNYKEAYANRGVAKINLLTKKGNIQPSKKETKDGCADLKKAKQLGDDTVDDMIYIYCGNK